MGHYGAETPKPERGWTNNTNFAKLGRGKMNMKEFSSTKNTVKKTICKKTGRIWYTGTQDLKSTQIHACNLCIQFFIVPIWDVGLGLYIYMILGFSHAQQNHKLTKDLSSSLCRSNSSSTSITSDWRWRYAMCKWVRFTTGSFLQFAFWNMAGGPFGAMHSVFKGEQAFEPSKGMAGCISGTFRNFTSKGAVDPCWLHQFNTWSVLRGWNPFKTTMFAQKPL